MTPICPYTDMRNILLTNKGTSISIFAHVRGPKPPKEVEARIIAFLIPYFSEENAFYRYMRALYLEKITQKFDFSRIKMMVTTRKRATQKQEEPKFESKSPEALTLLHKALDQAAVRASEMDLFTLDREWKTEIDEAMLYINAITQEKLISSLMWDWRLPILAPSYEEYQIFRDSQKQAPFRALLEYYGRLVEQGHHRPFREGLFNYIKSAHEIAFFFDRRWLENLSNVLEAWKSTCPQGTVTVSPIAKRVDHISQKASTVFSWILGGMLALRIPVEVILRAIFVDLKYLKDAHDLGNFFLSSNSDINAFVVLCVLKCWLSLACLAACLAKVLLSVSLSSQIVLITLVGCFIINWVTLFMLMSYDPRCRYNLPIRCKKIVHCMLIKPVQDACESASAIWRDRHRTSEWFAHIPQLLYDLSVAKRRVKIYRDNHPRF